MAPRSTTRDNVDKKADSSNSRELSPLPCYPVTSGPTVPPQVPGGLYLPMEDTVTALFFNSYIYTPRDPLIRPGSMEFLPQLYAAAPFDSHLRMSALAVAYFGVAAWTRQENLVWSAQQCFGKALARTRHALQGDVERDYDEILMTLMLLYIFEVRTGYLYRIRTWTNDAGIHFDQREQTVAEASFAWRDCSG
ncbi:hypothetical protein BDV10DRAFT_120873 [Aspergillus recurvatus]